MPAKKRKCLQQKVDIHGYGWVDVSSNKETKERLANNNEQPESKKNFFQQGQRNKKKKNEQPESNAKLRVTLELDPSITTFKHHVGKTWDKAERECSPWAGNNLKLFGKACPQLWGQPPPGSAENGKWNCYDADAKPPLVMNWGRGKYAASHVYIKIREEVLSGLWVIPLSGFANSYANARIWGKFQPTKGYSETWHSLRAGVSVTAIKIGQIEGGSRSRSGNRDRSPTLKMTTSILLRQRHNEL